LDVSNFHIIFVLVFHRILDFKAGLDFYLGPFFYAFTFLLIAKSLLHHMQFYPHLVKNEWLAK
jgi:hypothetical protein